MCPTNRIAPNIISEMIFTIVVIVILVVFSVAVAVAAFVLVIFVIVVVVFVVEIFVVVLVAHIRTYPVILDARAKELVLCGFVLKHIQSLTRQNMRAILKQMSNVPSSQQYQVDWLSL